MGICCDPPVAKRVFRIEKGRKEVEPLIETTQTQNRDRKMGFPFQQEER